MLRKSSGEKVRCTDGGWVSLDAADLGLIQSVYKKSIREGEDVPVGALLLNDWRHAQSCMSWGVHEKEKCNYCERLHREAAVEMSREGHRSLAGETHYRRDTNEVARAGSLIIP